MGRLSLVTVSVHEDVMGERFFAPTRNPTPVSGPTEISYPTHKLGAICGPSLSSAPFRQYGPEYIEISLEPHPVFLDEKIITMIYDKFH